jgi:hypothetical protein
VNPTAWLDLWKYHRDGVTLACDYLNSRIKKVVNDVEN